MSVAYNENFVILRKTINTVNVLRLLMWNCLVYDKRIYRDPYHKERLVVLYNIFFLLLTVQFCFHNQCYLFC
jgi:hypothetical protein